jgi:membrane protein YdbS with pleckstrin-like domain
MKYTYRFVFWNLFEFPQLLRYKAWRWAAGSNLLSRAIFFWLKPQQRSSR